VPALRSEERDAFLHERGHLLRIGTVDDEGVPLVVPIWFILDDGVLLVTPRERSAWLAHLRRDPRVCMTIDETGPPNRKVVARGTVRFVHDLGHDDEWRDAYRAIALRYVPEAWADAYFADTRAEPRALVGLDLATAEVSTWRMPSQPGENPLAVWAPRYYHR
jgi:nitroimidazol reductase NimA-like FMN-containing flavoprotein (pyridoxamine 5'-phosphate oxidase superfamily)